MKTKIQCPQCSKPMARASLPLPLMKVRKVWQCVNGRCRMMIDRDEARF